MRNLPISDLRILLENCTIIVFRPIRCNFDQANRDRELSMVIEIETKHLAAQGFTHYDVIMVGSASFCAPPEVHSFSGLLFDLDGTLVDSTEAIVKHWYE